MGEALMRSSVKAQPALNVTRLSRQFDGLSVLNGVSLRVAPGERVGIVGPNGAGKSTILRGIAGWTLPDAGRIQMLGHDVSHWPIHRRFRLGLRELPQFLDLSMELTGGETIRVAQWATRAGVSHSALSKLSLLNDDLRRPLAEMSFGSRRMIGFAAVLASAPKLLLLDEPTAGLDTMQRRALLDALEALPSECAVVLVEHDLGFIQSACHRLVELKDGCLQPFCKSTSGWT